jgi:hypothetical protein
LDHVNKYGYRLSANPISAGRCSVTFLCPLLYLARPTGPLAAQRYTAGHAPGMDVAWYGRAPTKLPVIAWEARSDLNYTNRLAVN